MGAETGYSDWNWGVCRPPFLVVFVVASLKNVRLKEGNLLEVKRYDRIRLDKIKKKVVHTVALLHQKFVACKRGKTACRQGRV